MNPKASTKAILLDIGNVLLKINWKKALDIANIPNIKAKKFQEIGQWQIYHDYESGLITREQFRLQLCQKLEIKLSPEQFEKIWCACFDGEVEGIADLLDPLAKKIPLYTLSNTNELHFEHFKKFPIFKNFKNLLVSHILHCRKPNKEIYLKAISHTGFKAEEILFIDDLEENLQAARQLGVRSEHCFQSCTRFSEILRTSHLL